MVRMAATVWHLTVGKGSYGEAAAMATVKGGRR